MLVSVRRFLLLVLATALAACGSGDDAPATPLQAEVTEQPASPAASAAASKGVKLVRVGSFDAPVHVTAPPGDTRRVFVVEQGGRIRVVRGGKVLPQPFLDVSSKTEGGGEQGLLSMAFAPDYASSGRFYVDYTDNAGDSRVVEYRRASADRADPASARQVLFQDQPESNHNGGLLVFGPDDLLYIGFGDGGGGGDQHGSRGNGQNLQTWLGKILRIDPRASGGRPYRVPSSNPFVGRSGAKPEIYSYGLRNPWRFSFDRKTGDLAIGDVGQNAVEEVSFVRKGMGAGANFGWRAYEGTSHFARGESAPGHVPPVFERSHQGAGWCSVTGGVVVRDQALAGLVGRYLVGDFCEGRVLSMRLARPKARDVRSTGLRVDALSSFGEDARGRVYVVSNEGPVYRIAAR
jgi:glucose/arabinose dehydrogenase